MIPAPYVNLDARGTRVEADVRMYVRNSEDARLLTGGNTHRLWIIQEEACNTLYEDGLALS